MQGQAPYHIEFRWVYGPPIPAGLAPEARKAMRAQLLEETFSQAAVADEWSSDSDVIGYPAASQAGRRPRRKRT